MAAVAHCSLPEGSESQWAWIYSPVLVYFLLSHLREKNVRHGLITACQDYWGIPVQEIQTPKEKKKNRFTQSEPEFNQLKFTLKTLETDLGGHLNEQQLGK